MEIHAEVGSMRIAKVMSAIGLIAMSAALVQGFLRGDFLQEGRTLLSMPWGVVSLVDLYVGFTLFSCWIAYREKSLAGAIIWILFVMVLGFFTASLYTLLALQSSQGDWQRFWMGRHSTRQL